MVIFAVLGTLAVGYGGPMATSALPRATPESQKVDPAGVLSFVDGLNSRMLEVHSFMLLRNGRVVAEGWWSPHGPADKHMLYSLSKSFLSTAIGLAIADGKLALKDKVVSFFPEQLPKEASAHLAEMDVEDLLTMTCGHDKEPMIGMTQSGVPWTQVFLQHPVPHKPGEHFLYNSAGSYMLSAIHQKATGKTLHQALEDRVFKPLGIVGTRWDQSPDGVDFGGWGLYASTEDIAKFGQLYLKDGFWNGDRILPYGWVRKATSKRVSNGTDPNNDWNQGYGYQFWRCRYDNYRGDGAFGQYCIVMPKYDAVLAVTSGEGDMGKIMEVVWETLLPAFDREPGKARDLKRKLASLELRFPTGRQSAAVGAKVSGKTFRASSGEPFPSMTVLFENGDATLGFGKDQLGIGFDAWRSSRTAVVTGQMEDVLARGAWTTDDTFEFKVIRPGQTWSLIGKLTFSEDRVKFERRMVGTFGPSELPTFEGRP